MNHLDADCAIFLLAKAYQKAHAMFKKRLAPYGITSLQHLVLEGLWHLDGPTASELSKILILDKATLSGVLDRMNEAGWIEKRQDENDKRIIRLYPSDKADELKESLVGERKKTNDEILAPFSYEEQILLKRFLKDMI